MKRWIWQIAIFPLIDQQWDLLISSLIHWSKFEGGGKNLLPLNFTATERSFYLGWLCQLREGGWLAVIKRGVISEFHTKQTLRHQNLAASILWFFHLELFGVMSKYCIAGTGTFYIAMHWENLKISFCKVWHFASPLSDLCFPQYLMTKTAMQLGRDGGLGGRPEVRFLFNKTQFSSWKRKYHKNCKCSPVSLFIGGSLWMLLLGLLFSIVRNVTHFHKGSQIARDTSLLDRSLTVFSV